MRHSRARKGNPVRSFFIVRTRQAEGDGGQWRGCQQCTLGKACEEAAVKPVSTLSKPSSSGTRALLWRFTGLPEERGAAGAGDAAAIKRAL